MLPKISEGTDLEEESKSQVKKRPFSHQEADKLSKPQQPHTPSSTPPEEHVSPRPSSSNEMDNLNHVSSDSEDQGHPELNDALYEKLMNSISEVWHDFDIDEGTIGLQQFKEVMLAVADHQGLDKSQEQVSIFFTETNLANIFSQI